MVFILVIGLSGSQYGHCFQGVAFFFSANNKVQINKAPPIWQTLFHTENRGTAKADVGGY